MVLHGLYLFCVLFTVFVCVVLNVCGLLMVPSVKLITFIYLFARVCVL